MSLRKKLNLICIGLAVLLIINIFIPAYEVIIGYEQTSSTSYWGNYDHLSGIIYLIEFIGALVIFALYHFDKMRDNKIALFFLGDFFFNDVVVLFRMINGESTGSYIYGFWLGLVLIIGIISVTIVSNYVSDQVKPNMRNNPQYGPGGPYNNMYNQPPMGYNQQPPMGYNNYR